MTSPIERGYNSLREWLLDKVSGLPSGDSRSVVRPFVGEYILPEGKQVFPQPEDDLPTALAKSTSMGFGGSIKPVVDVGRIGGGSALRSLVDKIRGLPEKTLSPMRVGNNLALETYRMGPAMVDSPIRADKGIIAEAIQELPGQQGSPQGIYLFESPPLKREVDRAAIDANKMKHRGHFDDYQGGHARTVEIEDPTTLALSELQPTLAGNLKTSENLLTRELGLADEMLRIIEEDARKHGIETILFPSREFVRERRGNPMSLYGKVPVKRGYEPVDVRMQLPDELRSFEAAGNKNPSGLYALLKEVLEGNIRDKDKLLTMSVEGRLGDHFRDMGVGAPDWDYTIRNIIQDADEYFLPSVHTDGVAEMEVMRDTIDKISNLVGGIPKLKTERVPRLREFDFYRKDLRK